MLGAAGGHRVVGRPGRGVDVDELGGVQGGAVLAPGDQHPPVGEHRGRVTSARHLQVRARRPLAEDRVVELGRIPECGVPPCGEQHLAAGEQGGARVSPRLDHRAGGGPQPGARVEPLGERAGVARRQHVSARQQRQGEVGPHGPHASHCRPQARPRVVDLRGVRAGGAGDDASGHEHPAVQQQGRPMETAGDPHRTGGRPGSGRRIVEEGIRLRHGRVHPSGDEHPPVVEHRGGVVLAAATAGPGGAPGSRPRDRRASNPPLPRRPSPADHEHVAVAEEHRGVAPSPGAGERAGVGPDPGGRIVQLHRGLAVGQAGDHQDLAGLQQDPEPVGAGDGHAAGEEARIDDEGVVQARRVEVEHQSARASLGGFDQLPPCGGGAATTDGVHHHRRGDHQAPAVTAKELHRAVVQPDARGPLHVHQLVLESSRRVRVAQVQVLLRPPLADDVERVGLLVDAHVDQHPVHDLRRSAGSSAGSQHDPHSLALGDEGFGRSPGEDHVEPLVRVSEILGRGRPRPQPDHVPGTASPEWSPRTLEVSASAAAERGTARSACGRGRLRRWRRSWCATGFGARRRPHRHPGRPRAAG